MHGMIFVALRKYVDARMGNDLWAALVAETDLADRVFFVAQQFPDSDFQALVASIAKAMDISSPAVLEDFGEFIAADLLRMHAHSVRPEWRTLDVIEHTEQAIHQVVRESGSGAEPPEIKTTRTSQSELAVAYASPRKLCSFAKGIVRGIAAHYGEQAHITETTCMLKGAERCTLEIRVHADKVARAV
jgi:predicted hydrocarbon binding protein